MKYLSKPCDDIRLAIILCLSLFFHVAILSSLSWSPSETSHHGNISGNDRRFTVTLASAPPAIKQDAPSPVEKEAVQDSSAVAAGGSSAAGKLVPSNEGMLPAVDTRYFTLAELDRRPAVIRDIPDNPPELLGYPQGGEVVLRLWIDKTGRVVNVESTSSELPQAFVDSARAGFLKAVFSPGRKLDIAVGSVMDVAVRYAPVPRYLPSAG